MITKEWGFIKAYIKKIPWIIFALVIAVFMSHGSLLFSERFGIDTEFIMSGLHNFNSLGRQGLVWLGTLLGLEWFNLYYAQALVLLFLILAPLSFGYLFYKTGGQEYFCSLPLLLLGLSFVVSPFWATQIYFLNQSPQILLSCILIPFTILFVEASRISLRQKWYFAVIAILLMQPIFSCYQVLIMLYVMGTAASFLFSTFKTNYTTKEQWHWILYHAVVFLCGFFIYLLISKLFFLDGTSYLQSQIWWNLLGTSEAAHLCLDTLRGLCGKNPPYTTGLYPIFSFMLLLVTFYQIITHKRKWHGSSYLFVFIELFIIASPSVFILLYGGLIPDRMQLLLPFSQGCILSLTALMLYQNAKNIDTKTALWSSRILILILAVSLWRDISTQMSHCNRLYYTDQWRYEYDKQLADDIYAELRALEDSRTYDPSVFRKIVFLGCPELPYNDTCIKGHVMGVSEFAFDAWENTIYRPRIVYFMRQVGYHIQPYFTDEEETQFFEYFQKDFGELAEAMPHYPSKNFVQVLSNEEAGEAYLIVKLGEEWWGWD